MRQNNQLNTTNNLRYSPLTDYSYQAIYHISPLFTVLFLRQNNQPNTTKQFTVIHRYLRYYFCGKQPAKHQTIYRYSPLFTVLFLRQNNQLNTTNNLPLFTVIYGITSYGKTTNQTPPSNLPLYHRYLRYYSYGKTTSRTPPNNLPLFTVIYGIILAAKQPAKHHQTIYRYSPLFTVLVLRQNNLPNTTKQFTVIHRYLPYYFYCKQPAKNCQTIYRYSPLFTVLFLRSLNTS